MRSQKSEVRSQKEVTTKASAVAGPQRDKRVTYKAGKHRTLNSDKSRAGYLTFFKELIAES